MKKIKETLSFQDFQIKIWDQYIHRNQKADLGMISFSVSGIFAKKQALFHHCVLMQFCNSKSVQIVNSSLKST